MSGLPINALLACVLAVPALLANFNMAYAQVPSAEEREIFNRFLNEVSAGHQQVLNGNARAGYDKCYAVTNELVMWTIDATSKEILYSHAGTCVAYAMNVGGFRNNNGDFCYYVHKSALHAKLALENSGTLSETVINALKQTMALSQQAVQSNACGPNPNY